MNLSDHIVFWERHRERPPLTRSSITFSGGGRYETMLDDGRVVWKSHDSIGQILKDFKEKIQEIREYQTPLFRSFTQQ